MKVVLIAACLLLVSQPVVAEDQAWFRMIGFSSDGTCAAWETGGIQDGSGFRWVEMEILDLAGSRYKDGLCHIWDEYIDEQPDTVEIIRIDSDIRLMCDKYGIQQDGHDVPLVYHPVTDLGVVGDEVSFCLNVYSPKYNSGEIRLKVTNLPADVEQYYPEWFAQPVTPVLHILVDGESDVFFSEEPTQEEYIMTYEYSIAAVYKNPVIPNSLLVVLHATGPGFEGPDGRFRVVSGSF